MILYEKESASKVSAYKDKMRALEVFNKDLFNKVSYYETAVMNYENDIKLL